MNFILLNLIPITLVVPLYHTLSLRSFVNVNGMILLNSSTKFKNKDSFPVTPSTISGNIPSSVVILQLNTLFLAGSKRMAFCR